MRDLLRARQVTQGNMAERRGYKTPFKADNLLSQQGNLAKKTADKSREGG